jgi:hypothetical protein
MIDRIRPLDGVPLSDGVGRLAKNSSRGHLSRWLEHYSRLVRSREQWVGFASQSFFHNPYLAAADMFFVHPGAAHGAISRCWANGWAMLGTCGIYSNGRDQVFKRLGLLAPNSVMSCTAAVLADTVYGFVLNLPGFMLNYALSGCGLMHSMILGFKACASVCWTSSISGGLFDTFGALDSDDPQKKARVPAWVRWLVIDRFALKIRRKLIWVCLAASILATAALYCFAPGGLLR